MGESTGMGTSEAGSSEERSSDEGDATLVVLRCAACGDTFPAHEPAEGGTCPSCGSADVHKASEPLL
jgi:rRNA maturation endonuclease Nob1